MLTKENVKEIRERVARALEAEFGKEVAINLGNIRYSSNEVKFTGLTIAVSEEGGNKEDALRTSWNGKCFLEGLKPEHFGKVITYNNKQLKLNSIHPRRQKYSIGAIDINTGKELLLDRRSVIRILGE